MDKDKYKESNIKHRVVVEVGVQELGLLRIGQIKFHQLNYGKVEWLDLFMEVLGMESMGIGGVVDRSSKEAVGQMSAIPLNRPVG